MSKKYRCHIECWATPTTKGVYNKLRGWLQSSDENAEDEGYLIYEDDSAVSWLPKARFDKGYIEIKGTNGI